MAINNIVKSIIHHNLGHERYFLSNHVYLSCCIVLADTVVIVDSVTYVQRWH